MPSNSSSPRRKPPRTNSPAEINVSSSPSLPTSPSSVPPPGLKSDQPVVEKNGDEPLPAYEFLGYLPDSYGTKKLFLVARDPHILFAYWDLNSEQYQTAARSAHDGKIFLEVYVPGEGRVQQIHVWENHRNWYLQVNRPDTAFFAQLGYYRNDGGFEVLARSGEIRTPRDTMSPNTEARFVTIPFHISFHELFELIAQQVLPGEELADTLARLQKSDYELPFPAPVPRDLTVKESEELLEYLGDVEVRRRMVGSFEITELLRKRFESALSSGQWNSSGGHWVSSVSSPFGASFGAARERDFHMHLNAELIIYGGTTPDAHVRIDGHDITLSKDGTFSYHFVFPNGQFHIPIEAQSGDGEETRGALLSFLRMTTLEGEVRKTGQARRDEPLGRKK
jgi:hypothetical protein